MAMLIFFVLFIVVIGVSLLSVWNKLIMQKLFNSNFHRKTFPFLWCRLNDLYMKALIFVTKYVNVNVFEPAWEMTLRLNVWVQFISYNESFSKFMNQNSIHIMNQNRIYYRKILYVLGVLLNYSIQWSTSPIN